MDGYVFFHSESILDCNICMYRYVGTTPKSESVDPLSSVIKNLAARGVTVSLGGLLDFFHVSLQCWLETIVVLISTSNSSDGIHNGGEKAENESSTSHATIRLRFLGLGNDCDTDLILNEESARLLLPFKMVTQDKVSKSASIY